MKSKMFTAVSILVFSLCLGVSAETTNDKNEALSAKKEEVKAKVEQMQEKVKIAEAKTEEKISFLQSLISKFKKAEVETLKTKTLKNFDVAIRNLENLSNRISSRIEKSDDQGKNTAEAKVLLEKANKQISTVKEEYKKLSEIIPDNFDKNSKKESKDAVKEQTKITKATIQMAQSLLSDAISSLKGQENKEDDTASTTIENLNENE